MIRIKCMRKSVFLNSKPKYIARGACFLTRCETFVGKLHIDIKKTYILPQYYNHSI